MSVEANKSIIESGKAVLGIELGSTRIKAVLVNEKNEPIASGSHEWENQYVNNIWTYSEEAIWAGIQDSYQDMLKDVKEKYGVSVQKLGAIGFSAMMHGYMPFNEKGQLLVPFRTWRNTMTEEASDKLTELFQYSPEMEHCSFVSGNFKERGARTGNHFHDYPGGICTLETDR